MKKVLYIGLGALLGLFLAETYNRIAGTAKVVAKPLARDMALNTPVVAPPAASVTKVTPTGFVTGTGHEPQPMQDVIPVVMGSRGAAADYALVKIAYKHPELKLSPQMAAELQDIFSSHYMLFAGLQAKLARATEQDDGSTLIQIPAFPAQGKQLADSLMADLNSYFKGDVPPGLAEALLQEYRGFTNSAGLIPVNLTVRVSTDPNYSYGLTRQTVFVDPTTGHVSGTGSSSEVLTKEQVLNSPYSELSKFFPKEPKG